MTNIKTTHEDDFSIIEFGEIEEPKLSADDKTDSTPVESKPIAVHRTEIKEITKPVIKPFTPTATKPLTKPLTCQQIRDRARLQKWGRNE